MKQGREHISREEPPDDVASVLEDVLPPQVDAHFFSELGATIRSVITQLLTQRTIHKIQLRSASSKVRRCVCVCANLDESIKDVDVEHENKVLLDP